MNFFQNTCLKERNNMAVAINMDKKSCLIIITWNKKHSSKQAVPITYTLGTSFLKLRRFFQTE